MEASTKKYREFAEECDRLAKTATSERQRAVLREMAQAWRELSEAPSEK